MTNARSQFDWEHVAETTGISLTYLKKVWPEVKKKAIKANPNFATAAAGMSGGATSKSAPKATAGKRRKPTADKDEDEDKKSDSDVAHVNKKAKSTRGRPVKKTKVAKQEEDEDVGKHY
jgi:hypothetical protein